MSGGTGWIEEGGGGGEEGGGSSHLARQQHLAHAAICISMPLLLTVVCAPTRRPRLYTHTDHQHEAAGVNTALSLSTQPEKAETVRTKRKYEKKPKIPPLSVPQHSGPSVFNPKDLNQYDFPSSDEEPFSQVTFWTIFSLKPFPPFSKYKTDIK